MLKESSSYDKLVRCLSQWLALMELCDDLLERLQLYGHAQYLDVKHAQDSLRQHWRTQPHEVSYTSLAFDKTKNLFSTAASKVAHKMSGLLQVVGIAGAIHSQVLKYLFGVYFTHPGFFVGSIVAAVALQFGSEKIEEANLLGEIDNICNNLQVVTSNLHSHYIHASHTLGASFVQKDSKKEVVHAINSLLEGSSKDNKASL